MAFGIVGGESRSSLVSGNFRQRSAATARLPQGDRRRPVPYVIGAYKPPVYCSDTIRLLDGHYAQWFARGTESDVEIYSTELPYWQFVDHFSRNEQKGAVCSGGPCAFYRDRREPCIGCELHWSRMEFDPEGKRRSDVSKSRKCGFSIIDYGVYHLLEEVDRQGNVRVSRRTGNPYMQWRKCSLAGCLGCAGRVQTKVGHAVHWPMPWSYLQQIWDVSATIGSTCATCGSELRSVAWVCSACGRCVVDMVRTALSLPAIAQVTEKPHDCACGARELLNEIIHCSECVRRRSEPRRRTLFDLDFRVRRVPTGSDRHVLSIEPGDVGDIPSAFQHLATPLDLEAIFAPTPLDRQAHVFRYSPPIGAAYPSG